MNDEFSSNNIENDDSYVNIEESDYENLIFRLKEISSTIALIEKHSLDKF